MKSHRLEGAPVVLVVGATSGIGRQTALSYARCGARLMLAARSADTLQEIAAECDVHGGAEVDVQRTDIADRAQVEALVDAAVSRYGQLDTAVQCAAVTAFGTFADVPPEVFDEFIATNLLGTANVARAVLAHYCRRGRGTLVLVGSVLGHAATPYQPPYVMSKFAISALVRLLRQEHHDQPCIRIHGIYPGAVDTPIYRTAANYIGWVAQAPPPVDPPEKIARAIVRVANETRSRDRSVGPLNGALVFAFRLLPTLFDALVGPLFRAVALTGRRIAPTSGNVRAPTEAGRAADALVDPGP